LSSDHPEMMFPFHRPTHCYREEILPVKGHNGSSMLGGELKLLLVGYRSICIASVPSGEDIAAKFG
jgi:hypothetical protein